MAKELPFFKFEPSEWDNGNIQMCSREAKGLFIDICSIYWSRIGDLPYALALHKYCNNDPTLIQELEKNEIIITKDDKIHIQFLDDQLEEFKSISEKRRKNAQKRWSKDTNANEVQLHSNSNAIREEKRREEKKREEKKRFSFKNELLKYGFDSDLVDDWMKVRKDKKASNTKTAFKAFISEIEKNTNFDINEVLKIIVEKSWKGFKWEWLQNLNNNQNGKSITKAIGENFANNSNYKSM